MGDGRHKIVGGIVLGKSYNNIDIYSRYYDTVGIRKMYQYIQTINITSIYLYHLVMFGRQIWYRNKQHFDITDIVISREHCNVLLINLSTVESLLSPGSYCTKM
jgi:hypothetical protein